MTDKTETPPTWDWKSEALGFLHEAFGLFASHRLARDSELGRKLDRARHALEHSPPLTAFVEKREPTARDEDQSAKLARAMAVVEVLLRRNDDGSTCDFGGCRGNQFGECDIDILPHDADCPLVVHGFLTPSGERVK